MIRPPDEGRPDPAHDSSFVRPFMITGGRTIPLTEGLRVETLIRAMPAALSAPLAPEGHLVVQLCQHPHSLAEIAAALHVPIGVARVIVGDLAADGQVSVLRSTTLESAAIERIRDLVRAL